MEFFLELALTISLPLLISFFIAKLFSKDPTHDELSSFAFGFQFGSQIHDLKTGQTGFVAVEDFVNDGEIECQSKQGNFDVLESRDENGNKFDAAAIQSLGLVRERVENDSSNGDGDYGREDADKVIDESPIGDIYEETGIERDQKTIHEIYDDQVFESDQNKVSNGVNGGRSSEEMIDGDDDWEGIERTELEKQFDCVVEYVRINDSKISEFGNELKMKLFGFHKIATEGACREPAPIALKISARAKWNAWKQLGNMSPEVAMESYINLVSENIPASNFNLPTVSDEQDASWKQASETKTQ